MSKYPASKKRKITYADLKKIKKENEGELKCVDTTFSDDVDASTNLPSVKFRAINRCGSGPAFYQRIGKHITMKSVRIKGAISLITQNIADPADLSTLSQDKPTLFFRMVVFYDKQPNSDAQFPSIDAIYRNVSRSGTETSLNDDFAGPESILPSVVNSSRFVILKDKSTDIRPKATVPFIDGDLDKRQSYTYGYSFDEYLDLKNKKTTFSGDGTSLGDIATGSLIAIFMLGSQSKAETGGAARTETRLKAVCRLRYTG